MLRHTRDILVKICEREIIYKIPFHAFPAELNILPESVFVVKNNTNMEIHFNISTVESVGKHFSKDIVPPQSVTCYYEK